jgi:hypothetical protein
MRCAICDSMLQLHSRSDICSTCQTAILEARLWYPDEYEVDLPIETPSSGEESE